MFSSTRLLGLAAAALSGSWSPGPTSPAAAPSIPFDEATLFLEYNATDGDAEIVIDVDAELGLERFRVFAPNGKVILDLRSKHTENLGLRKIRLETPEPSLEEVMEAYPEGTYRFLGRSEDGQILTSLVVLSHELPDPPVLTYPLEGTTNVPTSGSSASWVADANAEGYFLELEQEDLGVDIHSNLLGSATAFGFPAGWLDGDTEYQLGVGARGENGNLTVVEIHFTTAP